MSKIEKALGKAREEHGNLPALVSVPGTVMVRERTGHPETISRMAMSESRLLSAADLSWRGIIHPGRAEDPVVQVFRELRTKISVQCQERNSVILVTGLKKGSGGSFVARNLAAAFAFDMGRTALLIDCDLKNPSVHQLIDNASGPGLTDFLDDPNIDIGAIIQPVGIARYRAIAAGGLREIPGEYFNSQNMRRLLDSIRQRYMERFIILDGPPMQDIADIQVLSGLSDFVIVVARYGRATNAQIESCLNVINPGKLLGVVFNDEPRIPGFG